MNDREQAREELADLIRDTDPFLWSDPPAAVSWFLDGHPDLIRRALGMEFAGLTSFGEIFTTEAWEKANDPIEPTRRVWVEPPTDQGENDG